MNKSKIAVIAAVAVLTTAGLTVPAQNADGKLLNRTAITAYAADQVYTGNGYKLNYSISGNSATVTGFTKTTSASTVKVMIPQKLGGKNVTKIGAYVFNGAAVSEVSMPNTVTSLGKYAFNNCSKLTTITLSDKLSVSASGGYLFSGCTKLNTINVTGNMTDSSFLKTHIWVLSNCTVQGTYSVGGYNLNYRIQNAQNTGNGAEITGFAKTSSAATVKVDIPEKINGYDVKIIGDNAFNSDPVSELTMPDTVTTIGMHVFRNNPNLTKITLSKNLVDSAATGYLFNGCTGLKTVVASADMNPAFFRHLDYDWITDLTYRIVYNNNSYSLDYQIADNAVTLKKYNQISSANNIKVTIPSAFRGKNVTRIGDSAFKYSAVTEVIMPDTVTAVEDWAFYKASKLTTLRLSANLDYASGGYIFNGDDNLANVTIPNTQAAQLYAVIHLDVCKKAYPAIKQFIDAAVTDTYNTMKSRAQVTDPDIHWNMPASGWAREESKYQIARYMHQHLHDYMVYDCEVPADNSPFSLIRGRGSCVGMSKVYCLLLKQAGFRDDELELIHAPKHRLVGIQLFGEWYLTEAVYTDENSFAMRYDDEYFDGVPTAEHRCIVSRGEYGLYMEGDVSYTANAENEAVLAQKYGQKRPRGDVNMDGVYNSADNDMMRRYRNGENVQPNLVMSYMRWQHSTNPFGDSYWI